jgi:hypothetical protein
MSIQRHILGSVLLFLLVFPSALLAHSIAHDSIELYPVWGEYIVDSGSHVKSEPEIALFLTLKGHKVKGSFRALTYGYHLRYYWGTIEGTLVAGQMRIQLYNFPGGYMRPNMHRPDSITPSLSFTANAEFVKKTYIAPDSSIKKIKVVQSFKKIRWKGYSNSGVKERFLKDTTFEIISGPIDQSVKPHEFVEGIWSGQYSDMLYPWQLVNITFNAHIQNSEISGTFKMHRRSSGEMADSGIVSGSVLGDSVKFTFRSFNNHAYYYMNMKCVEFSESENYAEHDHVGVLAIHRYNLMGEYTSENSDITSGNVIFHSGPFTDVPWLKQN